jgi:N-acyl-D-amino-acid deacylase
MVIDGTSLPRLARRSCGFKGRRMLREGSPADIVIYDLNQLAIKPMEIVRDFSGGEWRRVKRAEGYPKILVTLEDGKATGTMSGKLLRYGA